MPLRASTSRLQGVPEGAQLLALGNIYRDTRGNERSWRVSGLFRLKDGSKDRFHFGIEVIPLLAPGRIYNAPESDYPYYSSIREQPTFILPSSERWSTSTKTLGMCPCAKNSLNSWREFSQQPCFVISVSGTDFWIPVIELARKLFFRAGFLVRNALHPSGLELLFNVRVSEDLTVISSLCDTGVHHEYIEHERYQQFFAWLLLTTEMKQSYESISRRLDSRERLGVYEKWCFDFSPPPTLSGCKLQARGFSERVKGRNHVLVQEITRLGPLPNSTSGKVRFTHPDLMDLLPVRMKLPAKRGQAQQPSILEIEAEERPDQQKKRRIQTVPAEELWLEHEVEAGVQRNGVKKVAKGGGDSEPGSDDNLKASISLMEDAFGGNGQPGELNNMGVSTPATDKGIEVRHHRLEQLKRKIEELSVGTANEDSLVVSIKAVPHVVGYSKHRLQNGKKRAYLFAYFIRPDGSAKCLIDVDGSDGKCSLSAKVFTTPSEFTAHQAARKILTEAVKLSMRWPTAYFRKLCIQHKSHKHLPLRDLSATEAEQKILDCSERLARIFLQ